MSTQTRSDMLFQLLSSFIVQTSLWERYSIITQLDKRDKIYQRAIFLNVAGPMGVRIYNSFEFIEDPPEAEEDKDDAATIIKKFGAHIIGKEMKDGKHISLDIKNQLNLVALKRLHKSCGFCKCLSDRLFQRHLHPTSLPPITRAQSDLTQLT